MTKVPAYFVTWADPETPSPDQALITSLSARAIEFGGELLALAPVSDVIERSLRPSPPWASLSRFADVEAATGWYEKAAKSVLTGSAVIVPIPAQPIWWPDGLVNERPAWSQKGDVPDDRIGIFVLVWISEIRDLQSLRDYSGHFRWTVERHGGVSIADANLPTVLAGDAKPMSMTLLTFPSSSVGLKWYDTPDYLSYRKQRHQASSATVVSIPARAGAKIPPR
jgi:uncharacterized protein (DUF1330 family)